MLFAACGEQGVSLPLKRPLPFPTPAQHDLIVAVSSGPLTYYPDDQGAILGLEHDLIEAFALELGVGVKYLVVPPDEIAATLDAGKAHLGVAWLPAPADSQQKATPPILQTADVLVQHEASLPPDDKDDLRGRTVHAMPGSRLACWTNTAMAASFGIKHMRLRGDPRRHGTVLLIDVISADIGITLRCRLMGAREKEIGKTQVGLHCSAYLTGKPVDGGCVCTERL